MSPINPQLAAPNREGILGRIRNLMEIRFTAKGLKCTRRVYNRMNAIFDKMYGTVEMEANSTWHLKWWERGGPGQISKMVCDVADQCLAEELEKPTKEGAKTTPKTSPPAGDKSKTASTPPASDTDNSDPDDDDIDQSINPDKSIDENLEPEG